MAKPRRLGNLPNEIDNKLDKNAAITPGTATKVTYDANGLVTGGSAATTNDLVVSPDKNFVTDQQMLAFAGLAGGTAGQVLTKVSGSNYNYQWANAGTETLATVTARGNTTTSNMFLGQYLRTGSYPHFGETVGGLATLVGNNILPGAGVNKIVRYAGVDNGTYINLRYNAGIIFATGVNSAVGVEVDDTTGEAMRITNNRNVLINTTVDTGDYKLDANGFFRLGPTSGHNISLGPDYTFKSLVSNTIITQDSENVSIYANNTGGIVFGTQAIPRLVVNNNGTITASSLAGTGTRMLVANSSGVLSTQALPNLSAYVPYTGATNNIDLGVNSLFLGSGVNGASIQMVGSKGSNFIVIENAGARMTYQMDSIVFTSKQFGGTKSVQIFTTATTGNNFNIGFPDASGTVALTSDIPSLSGYVPYTGASNDLNLGTKNILAQNHFIDGNGTDGGYLAIKQFNSTNSGQTGYTSLYALQQNSLYIRYSQTNGTHKRVELSSALLGTTGRYYLFPDKDGTFAMTNDIPSLSGYVQGSGTTNYVPKFTASGTIGNSLIFDNGTNVLINNTSDNGSGARLQVEGTATFSSSTNRLTLANNFLRTNVSIFYYDQFSVGGSFVVRTSSASALDTNALTIASNGAATFSSTITAGGNVLVPAGSGLAWSGDASRIMTPEDNVSGALIQTPGIIRFRTGGNEAMRINASGNVGINNTTPNRRLVIQGGAIANDQILYLKQFDDNGFSFNLDSAVTGNLMIRGVNAGVETASILTLSRSTGAATFSSNVTATYFRGEFYSSTLQAGINFPNNNDIQFRLGNADGRVIFNASGNVGIGVIPSAWGTLLGLQVGRANLSGYAGLVQGAWVTNNAFYNGSAWIYQTSAQASYYQQLSGEHVWNIAPAGTAGSAITFTQAMTLDASGRLAIGTPSATSRLQSNNASTFNSTTPSGAIIASNISNGNAIIDIGVDGSVLGYIQSRNITNTTTYNLLLNPIGGNVGIGTTSPQTILSVSDNGTGLGFSNAASGNFNIGLLAGTSSQLAYVYQRANSDLIFGTNNTERMRITSGGNVGIGTTNPVALLHVNSSTSHTFAYSTISGASPVGLDNSSGALAIWTGGQRRMDITSSGNVGIGTTSPTQRLSVHGSLSLRDSLVMSNMTTNPTASGIATYMEVTVNGTVYLLPLYSMP